MSTLCSDNYKNPNSTYFDSHIILKLPVASYLMEKFRESLQSKNVTTVLPMQWNAADLQIEIKEMVYFGKVLLKLYPIDPNNYNMCWAWQKVIINYLLSWSGWLNLKYGNTNTLSSAILVATRYCLAIRVRAIHLGVQTLTTNQTHLQGTRVIET